MQNTVLTIILNYRSADMTLRAAEAARVAMRGIDGAITIVDNDSQDGSFEKLCDQSRDWPDVRVIQSGHNGGFGFGNNVGIRAGLPDGRTPDFIYLQNPDAFPEPCAIRTLRDHLCDHPTHGFAGSSVYGEDGTPHMVAFRFPSILSEFESAAHTGPVSRLLQNYQVAMGLPQDTCLLDWCTGSSMMMRTAALQQSGLFDETFFLYFEETDLCRRMQAAGWLGAYVPHARAMHIGSATTGMGSWDRVPRYWFDSRAYYFRKHHGTPYLVMTVLAYLAGAGLWKTRRLIERKDDRIPPYFLRDLVAHCCQVLGPRATAVQTKSGAQDTR